MAERPSLRNAIPIGASAILLGIVAVALAAPFIAPHPPRAGILAENLRPPLFVPGGTVDHLLGTDLNGDDILTDLMYGARLSLTVGVVTVTLGGTVGVLIGLLAGYYGGVVDEVFMRLVDVMLAFPILLVAMLMLFLLGPAVLNVIVVLSFVGWIPFARLVRGEALTVRALEFVLAARAVGASDGRIMLRHILPNVAATVLVLATFAVPQVIITEAALSFLGLGVPVTVISWGAMLASGRELLSLAPWIAAFPGAAIMVTTLSINVLGDWARDRWDPRLRDL